MMKVQIQVGINQNLNNEGFLNMPKNSEKYLMNFFQEKLRLTKMVYPHLKNSIILVGLKIL